MRKIILLTVLLFIAAISVTGFYFSKIKLPGQSTFSLINQIPADAAFILEFKNDLEFYTLFKDNPLLTSFIGQKKASELQYLREHLLKGFFADEHDIFVSLHPQKNHQNIDILLTISNDKTSDLHEYLKTILLKTDINLVEEKMGNTTIYNLSFPALKEVFYISSKANAIAGSFNKQLLISFLQEKEVRQKNIFTPISDQQNKNSIANLYVNYQQFPALFIHLFRNQNNNFFRVLNDFSANAVLSLNYKSDALLFNGYTQINAGTHSYLQLFLKQQPVINTLKSVYPQNTASAIGFAFEKQSFFKSLDNWGKPEFKQANILFKQIKQETGISIQSAFRKQISNEFAVITTSESEKLAIIKLKNGSELEPFLQNISTNPDRLQSKIKYENLFFELLGEPFIDFKQPYFTVMDNYLFLANTETSLNNYLIQYHRQQFLDKDKQYLNFEGLLAEQSNVSFFVHFPNDERLLKNALRPEFINSFQQNENNWGNYYAMALQFTGSSNSFYTNFYLQQKQREISAVANTTK